MDLTPEAAKILATTEGAAEERGAVLKLLRDRAAAYRMDGHMRVVAALNAVAWAIKTEEHRSEDK